MKKITLLCVGKLKEKYFADAIDEYARRLSRYCEFRAIELPDIAGADEVRRESDELLVALGEHRSAYKILLDIGGRQATSEEFARIVDRAYLTAPEVVFAIGGSEGTDDRVRSAVDERISFGRMTYPHRLMRVILSEQIYRAFTIISGTPYHK